MFDLVVFSRIFCLIIYFSNGSTRERLKWKSFIVTPIAIVGNNKDCNGKRDARLLVFFDEIASRHAQCDHLPSRKPLISVHSSLSFWVMGHP